MGDTLETIEALRKLRPRTRALSIRQNAFDALAAEQMLLARLLMASAESAHSAEAAVELYREALNVALNLANGEPSTFLPLLRTSLEIVHRAAQELGDTGRASEALDRLQVLDASSEVR